ncbi:MAG: putative sugar nucleotidyl transferase [Planctomycetota bacterium]
MPFTIIFDDGRPLAPMTDLRPVFRLRTGVLTTIERWERAMGRGFDGVWAPERLTDLEADAGTRDARASLPEHDDVLLVNGACVLPFDADGLAVGDAVVDDSGGLVAARASGPDAAAMLEGRDEPSSATVSARLLRGVSDVIAHRDDAVTYDLQGLAPHGALPDGVHRIGDHPASIDGSATVGPGTVLDTSSGPILIGARTTVRPRATLIGPCAVLDGATVQDGAVIRGNTVIGPVCKVGGEVGGTIFQGHANKGHDGYLGDSHVGEWVNLGAGTNNSNLLNTYGIVKAPPHLHAPREPTGLTFFGCVIGDHAKTAIGSRITTGTLVGTGAMCATTQPPPSTTERFAWLTDSGASRSRWDRFEETMRTAMRRRGVEPSESYVRTLRALHDSEQREAGS